MSNDLESRADPTARPLLRMHLEPLGPALTIHLAGELDMSSAASLDELAATVDGAFDLVVLDVRELEFIDSSGIHALLGLRARVPVLEVRNPRRAVLVPLEILGLVGHLGVG